MGSPINNVNKFTSEKVSEVRKIKIYEQKTTTVGSLKKKQSMLNVTVQENHLLKSLKKL